METGRGRYGNFVPVELEGGPECQPIKWYVLVRDAEQFRERTGWGLANVWGWIQKEDYTRAREQMDAILRANPEQ